MAGNEEHTKRLDLILQTIDEPCDVILVVKDGKQFKAHGNVLRKASGSLFEKMLDGNWKESREGIIKLDMLAEETMECILEFFYSGSVDVVSNIISVDRAHELIELFCSSRPGSVDVASDIISVERVQELIEAADYLLLPNFRNFLIQKHAICFHHLAEKYQWEDLLAETKKFIHSNFVLVANGEDFLNLSSREVEKWISSDDVHVSAEDDIFRIILKWIEYDENERKKKFQDLFRHVRLGFVSRDCLSTEVKTNEFVKQDDICLSSVTRTLEWMTGSSPFCELLSQTPRKVLQKEALVVLGEYPTTWLYLPVEDK